MNIQEKDILFYLINRGYSNQRNLAIETGYALGTVNKALHYLRSEGYIDGKNALMDRAYEFREENRPKNAIILAAGFGMRMVPINMEYPKALLKYKNEVLIERIITQLRDRGVSNIYIVVGFMKEKFDYLIDKYGVELVVNRDYSKKNNLHSLLKVVDKIGNSYILPSDIWCRENPFHQFEPHSWYMIGGKTGHGSNIYLNRKQELARITDQKEQGNRLIGLAYISEEDSSYLKDRLEEKGKMEAYDDMFWESALFNKEETKMIVPGRQVDDKDFIEINTYEELRELDSESEFLKTEAMEVIMKAFDVDIADIKNIKVLKKGMTNRSFIFEVKGKRYIMRIPGEGTDELINRREEAQVYETIRGLNLCDRIILIDPEKGYKITEFVEDAHSCDPYDMEDLKKCITKLKQFHQMELKVNHSFDEFKVTEYYESLWYGRSSMYIDYEKTKENVFSLRQYISEHEKEPILSHFDANPDNFLIYEEDGKEHIRLIDWEYAAMHDPDIDIAMMIVYSKYSREQADKLIDMYYDNQCDRETRIKIYCYISICGLLWSNWCEYKSHLGVEFGDYSLMQYRYAKDYYKLAKREMEKLQ